MTARAHNSSKCSCVGIGNLLPAVSSILFAARLSEKGSQLLEAAVIVVPDVTHCFVRGFSNLLHSETFEVRQLQNPTLRTVEGFQGSHDELRRLVRCERSDVACEQGVVEFRYFSRGIKLALCQVVPPVDAAMIGILHNPRFSTAFGRVELCRRLINLQKNSLHDIFSFAGIPQNLERYVKNHPVMAIEKDPQSIVVAGAHMGHQEIVGNTL